ncbi:MAG: class I SAM-dependent methyltransferase [Deltaproteobacteria bacterium]|nr:class I SAM-dependent methyltransferase [Deltaproteobacteria bacterium]
MKIVSSFVFILPGLDRHGISNPVTYKHGVIAGQLKENRISILDAGSRDGWVVEFLNSLGYSNVIGVELLEDYVQYCKDMERRVILGDLHNLTFRDKSFDFVYCRHVIEHCLDPVSVLNELMRVTKIGGAVYCSFPLEDYVSGKHTTAVPTMKSVDNILRQIKYDFHPLYVGMAEDTSVVIPEGNEAIIFAIKKLTPGGKK